MNLFLPYPDDLARSASFLDDRRLNKQVVEAYQIGNIVLKRMRDPAIKSGWSNHPSTLAVYNKSRPKMPWLRLYITACNDEWLARGFRRSPEFLQKIETLFEDAEAFRARFSHEPVLVFVGGAERVTGDAETIGSRYRAYLEAKFANGKTRPIWTPAAGRTE